MSDLHSLREITWYSNTQMFKYTPKDRNRRNISNGCDIWVNVTRREIERDRSVVCVKN